MGAAAGCGETERVLTTTVVQTVTAPPADAEQRGVPEIGTRPVAKGEVVIDGDQAPKTYGPFTFEPGPYDFRFAQYAPGREVDFATEASSLTAIATRRPGRTADDTAVLVNATQRAGAAPITLSGKLYIEVQSADYAYVLRFTPRDAP
jgi:hypothetical protein